MRFIHCLDRLQYLLKYFELYSCVEPFEVRTAISIAVDRDRSRPIVKRRGVKCIVEWRLKSLRISRSYYCLKLYLRRKRLSRVSSVLSCIHHSVSNIAYKSLLYINYNRKKKLARHLPFLA